MQLKLRPREREILDMLADGFSRDVIVEHLQISKKNFSSQIHRAKKNNNISDRRRLVWCYRLQRAGVIVNENQKAH